MLILGPGWPGCKLEFPLVLGLLLELFFLFFEMAIVLADDFVGLEGSPGALDFPCIMVVVDILGIFEILRFGVF
jgi:hypothetical protein